MFRRQLALQILALYALAAIGCNDSDSSALHRDAGAGARSGPDAGRARVADAGKAPGPRNGGRPDATVAPNSEVCDAGPQTNGVKVCDAARFDWLRQCKVRYEGTQCYVASSGEACLPASDPGVIPKVLDWISSAGFQAEFVLDDAPRVGVPASCDKMLDCCAQQPDDMLATLCYDRVDDPDALQRCGDPLPAMFAPACPGVDADSGTAPVNDAAGVRFSLCCYKVCGYDVDT
jgi:hypothetical protein